MFGARRQYRREGGEVVHDQRRGGWAERVARYLPAYVALIVTVLGILLIANLAGDRARQETIDATARQLAEASYQNAYRQRVTSRGACERGNDQRVASVDQILDTAAGNSARANAWAGLAAADVPLPPTIVAFALEQERANRGEARAQIADAEDLIEAQAPVLLHPEADDLLRRAITDCDGQYPLPEHRGDPLPAPRIP